MKSKTFRERFRNRRTRRVYKRRKTWKNRNRKVGGTNDMVSVLNNTRKVMQTVPGILTIGEYIFEPKKKMSGGDWKNVPIVHNRVTMITTDYQKMRDIQKQMGGNNQLVSKYGEKARMMETIPGKLSIFLFENAQFEPKKGKISESKPIIPIAFENPPDNVLSKQVKPPFALDRIKKLSNESDSDSSRKTESYTSNISSKSDSNSSSYSDRDLKERIIRQLNKKKNTEQVKIPVSKTLVPPKLLENLNQPIEIIPPEVIPEIPPQKKTSISTSPKVKTPLIPPTRGIKLPPGHLPLPTISESTDKKPINISAIQPIPIQNNSDKDINSLKKQIEITEEEEKKIKNDIFGKYIYFPYLNGVDVGEIERNNNNFKKITNNIKKFKKAIDIVYNKTKNLNAFKTASIKELTTQINKELINKKQKEEKIQKATQVMNELFEEETKRLAKLNQEQPVQVQTKPEKKKTKQNNNKQNKITTNKTNK